MARVLLVGIDAATPSLLERWLSDGELPTLGRLAEEGCFGALRSVPNACSPAAWTTLATGVNPGRHGIFGFLDRIPGTYRLRQSNAAHRCAPPLWLAASAAGLRSAILHLPATFPADEVNGIQVAGWLTPATDTPGFTHPPELAGELARRFGACPLHTDVQRLVAAGRHGAARDRILSNLRARAEITEWLLAREPWDLMAVAFVEPDPAQHYFWHLTDSAHPAHDPALLHAVGDVVLQVWRELDRALGRLLAAAGEVTQVIIFSDHGAGPNMRGPLYLPALFDRMGWQVRRGGLGRAWRRAAGYMAARLPAGLKHRLMGRSAGRGADAVSRLLLGDIVWRRTRAWTFLHGGAAEPWLNLVGRDPGGTVAPGEEADVLRAELCEALTAATDPVSGARAIRAVHRREDLYDGPHLGFAPDLLIEWEEGPVLAGLGCGGVEVTRPEAPTWHSGSHRRDGLLLAWGEGVRSGAAPAAEVADLAPTVLHLLGLPVPGYMDGRVLMDLFRDGALPEPIVDHDAPLPETQHREDESSAEVTARLRGLGYL